MFLYRPSQSGCSEQITLSNFLESVPAVVLPNKREHIGSFVGIAEAIVISGLAIPCLAAPACRIVVNFSCSVAENGSANATSPSRAVPGGAFFPMTMTPRLTRSSLFPPARHQHFLSL